MKTRVTELLGTKYPINGAGYAARIRPLVSAAEIALLIVLDRY